MSVNSDVGGGDAVPAAPYPPMAGRPVTTGRSRSRSFSNNAQGKALSTINPQSSRNVPAKKQLPARVEYISNDIYGGVNCLDHNDERAKGAASSRIGGGNLSGPLSNNNHSSQSNARIKKLGPVLLELKYLQPRSFGDFGIRDEHQNDGREILFTGYHAKSVAVSRGISSTGNFSTCLSFRKGLDIEADDIQCATGLTTGSLCIHTFRNVRDYIANGEEGGDGQILDGAKSDDVSTNYFSYYQPRHQRHASSVAWRPGSNSRYVAIGLMGANSTTGHGSTKGGSNSRSTTQRGGDGYSNTGLNSIANKEGDYCALVWDIEATSSKGMKQAPSYRLAHHSGVASLEWMGGGDLLAVGCSQRSVQIYDLRISGTSAPPLSFSAHDNAVHGIEVNPHRPMVFATFSRGLAEPVKLWDMRKTDSCLSEIKIVSSKLSGTSSTSLQELPTVSAVAWDTSASGVLGIASNQTVRFYDARINPSRPTLMRVSNSHSPLQSIAFQPCSRMQNANSKNLCLPKRMLAVAVNGAVLDLPLHQASPIALSSRNGGIAHSLGDVVWTGNTDIGPAAMDRISYDVGEDFSATMMRRARCLHITRYSTDPSANLEMISFELKAFRAQLEKQTTICPISERLDSLSSLIASREQLYRLWSWIDRVEKLCFRSNVEMDERRLPAKGLQDAGILRLLKMDVNSGNELTAFEKTSLSPLFHRNVFDSPMRRAALTACGWVGKYGLKDVLEVLESRGKYERSAALAVWNSDLGQAVAALQRGAAHVRSKALQCEGSANSHLTQYAETLELVAMCIAGYSVGGNQDVWTRACESLLRRRDIDKKTAGHQKQQAAYLRAICSFLMKVGSEADLVETLEDELLNLSDRVAFACIFLARDELKQFLESTLDACVVSPNLEGVLISGINRKGIALLQSYVDSCSDVQTVALVSSRIILPHVWKKERDACVGWLETYRDMLNKWQMWKSRAMFDVGRVELLRKLKGRQQAEEQATHNVQQPIVRTIRRSNTFSQRRQQSMDGSQMFPAQLHARCNYCNTSLALPKLLRRQDGIANKWLSRQNPALSSCPNSQCRKPLPRCAICLLPMGCLNPYLELRKNGLNNIDDLSDLSSLPFAEWFTWCMRCKHGGHAHHMVGWFSKHQTCPVSGCDCQCQFDGIQKLKRPGLKQEEE